MYRMSQTSINLNSAAWRLDQSRRQQGNALAIALDNWEYFFQMGRYTEARQMWAEVERLRAAAK